MNCFFMYLIYCGLSHLTLGILIKNGYNIEKKIESVVKLRANRSKKAEARKLDESIIKLNLNGANVSPPYPPYSSKSYTASYTYNNPFVTSLSCIVGTQNNAGMLLNEEQSKKIKNLIFSFLFAAYL
jgi:hypothetical protein